MRRMGEQRRADGETIDATDAKGGDRCLMLLAAGVIARVVLSRREEVARPELEETAMETFACTWREIQWEASYGSSWKDATSNLSKWPVERGSSLAAH